MFIYSSTNKNADNLSNNLKDNKINKKFKEVMANVSDKYKITVETITNTNICISAIKK